MSGEIDEGLIEDDPDGETDSGPVHRVPPSDKSRPQPPPDDTIDFDPDGETDTITEVTELPDEMAKSADETR